jgi:hypothetical protein
VTAVQCCASCVCFRALYDRLWSVILVVGIARVHGHKHVSDLEHLSFFVLGEADRMVQQVRQWSACLIKTVTWCAVLQQMATLCWGEPDRIVQQVHVGRQVPCCCPCAVLCFPCPVPRISIHAYASHPPVSQRHTYISSHVLVRIPLCTVRTLLTRFYSCRNECQ